MIATSHSRTCAAARQVGVEAPCRSHAGRPRSRPRGRRGGCRRGRRRSRRSDRSPRPRASSPWISSSPARRTVPSSATSRRVELKVSFGKRSASKKSGDIRWPFSCASSMSIDCTSTEPSSFGCLAAGQGRLVGVEAAAEGGDVVVGDREGDRGVDRVDGPGPGRDALVDGVGAHFLLAFRFRSAVQVFSKSMVDAETILAEIFETTTIAPASTICHDL